MRSGTLAILKALKQQRGADAAIWGDVADDVLELGKARFLSAIQETTTKPATKRVVKAKTPADPLAGQLERYRKKTGLKAAAFIAAVHSLLKERLPPLPSNAVLSSAPKYLLFAKASLSSEEIEIAFASVLSEHG
jgi:hypothetical protein